MSPISPARGSAFRSPGVPGAETPRDGTNIVAYLDATDQRLLDAMDYELSTLENLKAFFGDRFEATVRFVKASVKPNHMFSPVWVGTRTYHVSPMRLLRSLIGFSSPVLEASEHTTPPHAEEFGSFLGAHMKPYKTNIVLISGHGDGTVVAGMPTKEIGQALDRAREISGMKPDILILNGCFMMNAEGLRPLQDKADLAIAGEEFIADTPLYKMFLAACETPGSSKDMARKMIGQFKPSKFVTKMAAIDLSKIEPLARALDNLKALVEQDYFARKEDRVKIQCAIAGSHQALPAGRTVRSINHDIGDLGAFLEMLRGTTLPQAIREAAQEAEKRSDEAVLAKQGKGLGLSFLMGPELPFVISWPDNVERRS